MLLLLWFHCCFHILALVCFGHSYLHSSNVVHGDVVSHVPPLGFKSDGSQCQAQGFSLIAAAVPLAVARCSLPTCVGHVLLATEV